MQYNAEIPWRLISNRAKYMQTFDCYYFCFTVPLESSSTDSDMLEVSRLLMSNEAQAMYRKNQKKVKKSRQSPLKTFKKVTLSFIERPKKSTQTHTAFDVEPATREKAKHGPPQQCEPNLDTDLQIRIPPNGAVELRQVGSSDAEQTCSKNEKHLLNAKVNAIQEPSPAELQRKVKYLVGDILQSTLSSQLAGCAIKRALETAFETNGPIEGTSGNVVFLGIYYK